MRHATFFTLALFLSGAAHADAVRELFLRQKPGMWEWKQGSPQGRPALFCVTEKEKAGGLEQTLESMKELGCKRQKDIVDGDRFEIELVCAHENPDIGRFRMTMKGIVRADYMTQRGAFSGGGPLIQSLAREPGLQGSEWRWSRPCRPGEKPGLQAAK